MNSTLKPLSDWLLPPNMFRLLTQYRFAPLCFALTHSDVLARNKQLLNRHAGKRCFILCNGPSVKQQDITVLKKEIVFSVSSGYKHPDYAAIAPRYHCVPQLTYSDKITPPVAIEWFAEMDAGIGGAELFLDSQEYALVQKHHLFPGRQPYYLCTGRRYFPHAPKTLPDMAGIIPRAQSVPITALMLALYMGFKKIYLLGTDHDWFVKKEYRYFYEPTVLKGKDTGVRVDGSLETTLWDELPAIEKMWSQYRAIKALAQSGGAAIYNASPGSMLDEFPRVRLEEVVCR